MAPQVSRAAQAVDFAFYPKEQLPDDWTCSFCNSGEKELAGKKIKFVTDYNIIVHGDCAKAMKNLAAVFGPNRDWVGEIRVVSKLDDYGNQTYDNLAARTLRRLSQKECILILFSQDNTVKEAVKKHNARHFSRNCPGEVPHSKNKDEIRSFLLETLESTGS